MPPSDAASEEPAAAPQPKEELEDGQDGGLQADGQDGGLQADGRARETRGRGRGRGRSAKAKTKSKAKSSPPSAADQVVADIRSKRDEKRRLQMCFQRATNLSVGGSFENGNTKKMPQALIPSLEEDRDALWDSFYKNNGNWGKVLVEVSKTSTKIAKRKGKRRWVFEQQLIDDICNGDVGKAMKMKKQLLSNPLRNRVHPDMEDDDPDGVQYHALAFEEDDEESEENTTKNSSCSAQVRGEDEQIQRTIVGMSAPKAKSQPAPKKEPPACSASSKASKGKAAKAKAGAEQLQQAREDTEHEEDTDHARKEAEKKKKDAEAQRKKEEPLERSKIWLGAVPSVLRDLDIAHRDAASKKYKNVIPDRFISEFADALKAHSKMLLVDRTKFEKICGVKDAKVYKKKCDFLEDAEEHLNEARKTLKAWKHTAHVYLQEPKK